MSDVTVEDGTQIRLFITGSFSPADVATNFTMGVPTDVVFTRSALADDAGRQSDKFDLGANRAREYMVLSATDFTGETPPGGGRMDYYWLSSTHTTPANGNIAGNSGADAAAPGGALGSITLIEFAAIGTFIGSLEIHDGISVQNGEVARFSPPTRYGQILEINKSGDALEADDVENHVVLIPIIDDVA